MKEFKDDAVDFLVIYIREAHATNGWYLFKIGHQIQEHCNLEERVAAATTVEALRLPCPVSVDSMDDKLTARLEAMPERFAAINDEGRLIWKGKRGAPNYTVSEAKDYLTMTFRKHK